MSVCISLFLTTIVCATGVRLVAGPTKWEGIMTMLIFLLPAVILLFALFLYPSEKLLKKFGDPFDKTNLVTVELEKYEKVVQFIGYIEVVSGLFYACIASWILIAYKFTCTNAIILVLSFLTFSSGYLLIKKTNIGIYLSLFSQAASIINFSTADYIFYFGNIINFTAGLTFSESAFTINIVSIVFFIILVLNIKTKPNKRLQ